MTSLFGQLLQGLLQGGVYALVAIGLSLSIGVVRLINLAHGDFVILASYGLLTAASALSLNPVAALLLVIPLAAALGFALQKGAFQRIAGEKILSSLLLTFGMSIVIQNGLLLVWGGDPRRLAIGTIETIPLELGANLSVGVFPLLGLLTAIVLVAALDGLLYRTDLGARIRAVAQDKEAADLIGLSSATINAITMALIGTTVAIAAFFVGVRTSFDPATGPTLLLNAFEAVIIGGLGSLWGTLAGGILLGLAQAIGAEIDVTTQVLVGHLTFLAIIMVRPKGIFGEGYA